MKTQLVKIITFSKSSAQGKFIALNEYFRKREESKSIMQVSTLRNRKIGQIKSKLSGRAEINELENGKQRKSAKLWKYI